MSNISKTAIYYPTSVVCELKENKNGATLWISGAYGTWYHNLPKRQYKIIILNNFIKIETIHFYSLTKYYFTSKYRYAMPIVASQMSLLAILIKRMIVGAGVGYKKYLRVKGVGYKFEIQNCILSAKVGYTKLIYKQIPSEFFFKFSRKFKALRFRSKSLNKLTGVLAELRRLRPPDVYKGKGIRYRRDKVRRKPAGKSKRKTYSKKKIITTKKTKKKVKKKKG